MTVISDGRASGDASPSPAVLAWGCTLVATRTRSAWQDLSGEDMRSSQQANITSLEATPLRHVETAGAGFAVPAAGTVQDDVQPQQRRKTPKPRATNLVSFLLPGTLTPHSGSMPRPFTGSPPPSPRPRKGSGDSTASRGEGVCAPPGPCSWKREGPRRRSILKKSSPAQQPYVPRRDDVSFASITDMAAMASDVAAAQRPLWGGDGGGAMAGIGAGSPCHPDQYRQASPWQMPAPSSCAGSGYSPGATTIGTLASSASSRLRRSPTVRGRDCLDVSEDFGDYHKGGGDSGGGVSGGGGSGGVSCSTTTIAEQLELAHTSHTASLQKRRLASARRQQRRTSNGSVRRISFSPYVSVVPNVPGTATGRISAEATPEVGSPQRRRDEPGQPQQPQKQQQRDLEEAQSGEKLTLQQLPDKPEVDVEMEQQQQQLAGWGDRPQQLPLPVTVTVTPPPQRQLQEWHLGVPAAQPSMQPQGSPQPLIQQQQQQQQPVTDRRLQLQQLENPTEGQNLPQQPQQLQQKQPQQKQNLSPKCTSSASSSRRAGFTAKVARAELKASKSTSTTTNSGGGSNAGSGSSTTKQRKPGWRGMLAGFMRRHTTTGSGYAPSMTTAPLPSPNSHVSFSEDSATLTPPVQLRVMDSHVFNRHRVALRNPPPGHTPGCVQPSSGGVAAGKNSPAWGPSGCKAAPIPVPPRGPAMTRGSAAAAAPPKPALRPAQVTAGRSLGEGLVAEPQDTQPLHGGAAPPAWCSPSASSIAAANAPPPPPSPSLSPSQQPKPSRGASLLAFLGIRTPRTSDSNNTAHGPSSNSSNGISRVSHSSVGSGGAEAAAAGGGAGAGGHGPVASSPGNDNPDLAAVVRSMNPSASSRMAPGELASLQGMRK